MLANWNSQQYRGPSYGPEIWPQPVFASDAGLTLSHASVSGGKLSFDGSGIPGRTDDNPPASFTSGSSYAYSLTVSANPGNNVAITLAGSLIEIGTLPGTYTGTVVASSDTAGASVRDDDNNGGTQISAFSIKKVL